MTSSLLTAPPKTAKPKEVIYGSEVRFRMDRASHGRCDEALGGIFGDTTFLVREYDDGPFVIEDGMVKTVIPDAHLLHLLRYLEECEGAWVIKHRPVRAIPEGSQYRILEVVH